MATSPATAAQLRDHLAEFWPDRDTASLAHAVRCLLPTIQIPPRGIWGKGGNPTMATAEQWLGSPVDPAPSAERVVLRYLAAYGPASVADAQTWSGLTRLNEIFDRLDLVTYTDENSGRTLYDLPDITLPDEDTEVPVRFLPEYDNLLLSHADRSRWITPEDRTRLTLNETLSRGATLHNGRVVALWKTPKPTKSQASVEIQPITPLSAKTRASLLPEAHNLLSFTSPKATPVVKFLE